MGRTSAVTLTNEQRRMLVLFNRMNLKGYSLYQKDRAMWLYKGRKLIDHFYSYSALEKVLTGISEDEDLQDLKDTQKSALG